MRALEQGRRQSAPGRRGSGNRGGLAGGDSRLARGAAPPAAEARGTGEVGGSRPLLPCTGRPLPRGCRGIGREGGRQRLQVAVGPGRPRARPGGEAGGRPPGPRSARRRPLVAAAEELGRPRRGSDRDAALRRRLQRAQLARAERRHGMDSSQEPRRAVDARSLRGLRDPAARDPERDRRARRSSGRGALRGRAHGQGAPDARSRRKPEQVLPRRRGDRPRRGMADGDVGSRPVGDDGGQRAAPLPVRLRVHRAGMSKARVLVLATTLPAVRDDGTPQFVLDLSLGLQETFDVLIVAPRVPAGRPEEEIDGLRIELFGYFPRRWESLADGAMLPNLKARPSTALQVPFLLGSFLWSSFRAGRRFRPDVIHAHWLVPGGFVALLVSRLLSVPYVVTVHGADAFALRAGGLQWLKRVIMRNAAVVGLTSAALAEAVPDVDAVPQPVIPMGVDVEGFAQGAGEREPVFGQLLFVGRLAEKKGVDVLLSALAAVPDATLVVGGDGPDAERLRALSGELGVAGRVRFAGRLSRPMIRDELRSAYAVVIPSKVAADGDQDTTPLVMSESMSAAVPVIASRLGGLAEQIESEVTGLLAEPDAAHSLADALRRALADPDKLAGYGRQARDRIRGSALDLRTTVARYTEILGDVVSKRPR